MGTVSKRYVFIRKITCCAFLRSSVTEPFVRARACRGLFTWGLYVSDPVYAGLYVPELVYAGLYVPEPVYVGFVRVRAGAQSQSIRALPEPVLSGFVHLHVGACIRGVCVCACRSQYARVLCVPEPVYVGFVRAGACVHGFCACTCRSLYTRVLCLFFFFVLCRNL